VAAGTVYSFGPFTLDASARRLTRHGSDIALSDRYLDVLVHLVAHAGTVVTKNALIDGAWRDVAVTDNSLEQAISALRRAVGNGPDDKPYIQTVPRQGYRFAGAVARTAARISDAALDAILAPHRAWVEGRAALETLEADQVIRAHTAFDGLVAGNPDQAAAHVGLANACILQFEMTRSDAHPDAAALAKAAHHAREACRLDANDGEAWATLGFVLDRTGHHIDALAASKHAITLEPENWRHHFRLAYVGWGEERLRAAHRTLALLPGFPLAHWLAATVYVGRQVLDEAERELAAGIASEIAQVSGQARFSSVALHWLRGLVFLASGDEDRALVELERELTCEASGHLYARECCANTWYAIGAIHLRHGRLDAARTAFEEALARLAAHVTARLGIAAADTGGHLPSTAAVAAARHDAATSASVEDAMCRAAACVLAGDAATAGRLVDAALARAAAGSAGWLLPIEPILRVQRSAEAWQPALARLRARAS
jgi:DNA-binding winged helix-turn-helix (wHTH) protein/cytochrome c-type biogenesis protein CcmH/NrfG